MRQGRIPITNLLAGLCLALAAPDFAHAAATGGPVKKPEPTPAELIKTATKKTSSPEDRTKAIEALSKLSPAGIVRDFRVVEGLLDLAHSKDDDMFVRIAAIEGLGNLQFSLFTQDDYAKNKYIEPFTALIKNSEEPVWVRVAAVDAFRRTLKSDGIKDKEAFETLRAVAENDEKGNKAIPLIIRKACTSAIGEFGSEKGIQSLVNILSQLNLDLQLREAAVQALSSLLGAVTNVDLVTVPTINKLIDMAAAKDFPVEIRAEVLRALARLHAQGAKGVMPRLLEILLKVLADEDNPTLVVSAIEALGILGEDSGLAALDKTYTICFDKNKPGIENDVKIRQAIMRTMGPILSAQNLKRGGPTDSTVKLVVDLLLKCIDRQTTEKEVPQVVNSAILSLRYLYPKKPAFTNHHKVVIEKFIELLQPKPTPDQEQIHAVMDTLKYLADQDYTEPVRWIKWFERTYGHAVKVNP